MRLTMSFTLAIERQTGDQEEDQCTEWPGSSEALDEPTVDG